MSYSRLKDMRVYEDWTQQMVANMISCHLHTYRKYENKTWEIMPVSKALILAEKYNVTLDYLLCVSEERGMYSAPVTTIMKSMKYFRRTNAMTQKQIAQKIHCDPYTYKKYELGQTDIPSGTFCMLAKIYGITISMLAGIASK